MDIKEIKRTPDFGVKVIWLSPEKILALKYKNFDETFKIENFKYDYQLIDFVYGNKVKTVQLLDKKPFIIKIANNPYKAEYGTDWWGKWKKSLSLKEELLNKQSKCSVEYIKYQELYMEFLKVKIVISESQFNFFYRASRIHKLNPSFTNEQIKQYYQDNYNVNTEANNSKREIYTFYFPIKNYHFEESNFKMIEMQPYEERVILEEICYLTKQYLKLNEIHKCNC